MKDSTESELQHRKNLYHIFNSLAVGFIPKAKVIALRYKKNLSKAYLQVGVTLRAKNPDNKGKSIRVIPVGGEDGDWRAYHLNYSDIFYPVLTDVLTGACKVLNHGSSDKLANLCGYHNILDMSRVVEAEVDFLGVYSPPHCLHIVAEVADGLWGFLEGRPPDRDTFANLPQDRLKDFLFPPSSSVPTFKFTPQYPGDLATVRDRFTFPLYGEKTAFDYSCGDTNKFRVRSPGEGVPDLITGFVRLVLEVSIQAYKRKTRSLLFNMITSRGKFSMSPLDVQDFVVTLGFRNFEDMERSVTRRYRTKAGTTFYIASAFHPSAVPVELDEDLETYRVKPEIATQAQLLTVLQRKFHTRCRYQTIERGKPKHPLLSHANPGVAVLPNKSARTLLEENLWLGPIHQYPNDYMNDFEGAKWLRTTFPEDENFAKVVYRVSDLMLHMRCSVVGGLGDISKIKSGIRVFRPKGEEFHDLLKLLGMRDFLDFVQRVAKTKGSQAFRKVWVTVSVPLGFLEAIDDKYSRDYVVNNLELSSGRFLEWLNKINI